ncbi:hypothetical protein KCP70_04735 [Salmonella enterica subsp. enterica]|nr:hypothetical protein KCP70_04735 [Salmonella enterica subsp. enterica]
MTFASDPRVKRLRALRIHITSCPLQDNDTLNQLQYWYPVRRDDQVRLPPPLNKLVPCSSSEALSSSSSTILGSAVILPAIGTGAARRTGQATTLHNGMIQPFFASRSTKHLRRR